jgi:hypothetical protein
MTRVISAFMPITDAVILSVSQYSFGNETLGNFVIMSSLNSSHSSINVLTTIGYFTTFRVFKSVSFSFVVTRFRNVKFSFSIILTLVGFVF